MKLIPLTRDYFAKVSDCDFDSVSQFKWYAKGSGKGVYAARSVWCNGATTTVRMHRFILGITDSDTDVDHANHDGLDNQRENIRSATRSQNQYNKRNQANNTTGYKGVSYFSKLGKYGVQYGLNGKNVILGYFDCPKEGARHYNRAAKAYGEGFELLNDVEPMFPTSEYISKNAIISKNKQDRIDKYFSELANGLHSVKCLGVSFSKKGGCWMVRTNGSYLGIFPTKSEAIAARDAAQSK